jgi:hypothetical protein
MLDDLWMILGRILLYPIELVADLWFAIIEWLIELIGNTAPDAMPSIPDAPAVISWPRVGLALLLCASALAIVNGILAGAVWLGFLHFVLAYLAGGLISLGLLAGTSVTLFRLIIDPPRARSRPPRKARAGEQKPPGQ